MELHFLPRALVLLQRRINQNGSKKRWKLASGKVAIKIFPQLARELPRNVRRGDTLRRVGATRLGVTRGTLSNLQLASRPAQLAASVLHSLSMRSRLLSFAPSLSLVASS